MCKESHQRLPEMDEPHRLIFQQELDELSLSK